MIDGAMLELGQWGQHVLELMEVELLRIEAELGRGEVAPSRVLAIRFRHERMGELMGGIEAALVAA